MCMKTQCIRKAILVLTRFNKIAIQNYKFQVAIGQRSHLLVEVPTISINALFRYLAILFLVNNS